MVLLIRLIILTIIFFFFLLLLFYLIHNFLLLFHEFSVLCEPAQELLLRVSCSLKVQYVIVTQQEAILFYEIPLAAFAILLINEDRWYAADLNAVLKDLEPGPEVLPHRVVVQSPLAALGSLIV